MRKNTNELILLGVGANLPSPHDKSPRQTCEAALAALDSGVIAIVSRSRWYRTAPVPPSDQPWYVNGVAVIDTAISPAELLDRLKSLERQFGRTDTVRNAARVLDMDLLAYGELVQEDEPILPHPRMSGRAFVLFPLVEVAPGWRHPVEGKTVESLIEELPPGQTAEPIEDGA